jgi:hypothetical protein
MEQRRFHRVNFCEPGELLHHEITYHGRLENISLRGALISSDECIMVPLGDTCTLSIFPCPDAPPIVLTAQVVHSFFSMVGIKFVGFTGDAESRLFELMQQISGEPETLKREWEAIEKQRGKLPVQNNEVRGMAAANACRQID